MRIPIIAGNWKMNNTNEEGLKLIEEIKNKSLSKDVEGVICVPFTLLAQASEALKATDIKLGAQNMHFEEAGAYTGEVSGPMLKNLGVDYVILGHSERRQYFNETDETVNKKIKAALKYDLNPIVCVGETLEEREASREELVVKEQVEKALAGLEASEVAGLVIAYEPIWAIGTGRTASSDDANKMLEFIRTTVEKLYNQEVASEIRLQYGGSVKPSTIKELMEKPDVDGALVGGASLKADDFSELINF